MMMTNDCVCTVAQAATAALDWKESEKKYILLLSWWRLEQ